MKDYTLTLTSIILAGGLVLAGYFVGNGIVRSKKIDRFVTVKGLSEREVQADIAIWPITFSITANELYELKKLLDAQGSNLQRFFIENGLGKNEITLGIPHITDTKASYYGGNSYQQYRYIGKGKLTIQTKNIMAIHEAMSKITDLIGQGIVIEQDEYRNRIQYDFTGLNNIKPEMIKEATQNARLSAQQFAADANAELGSIRKASQGYFSISDRDMNTPYIKKVRVVTTVEYYLN
jgi:hypothetical protein